MEDKMKKMFLMGFFLGSILFGLIGGAGATVITFEEFEDSNYVEIYDGYSGFNWFNFSALNKNYHVYPSTPYSAISGKMFCVSMNDSNSFIKSIGFDFDFIGAWFTSNFGNNYVGIYGFNDGVYVNNIDLTLSTTSATWVSVNFLGIDELVFSESYFSMDDFTYRVRSTAEQQPVPEPSTFLLFGAGLAGLFGLRRFKR